MYSRVCLCLENTGQEETLLMRLPWEGALETPLDFPPGGMHYFCNLKNQFGECWVFGWGEALILLPVGGVAFRGLTWQGLQEAARGNLGRQAGALGSAPPQALGAQEWAGRGSPGPVARAPFPRGVLRALRGKGAGG